MSTLQVVSRRSMIRLVAAAFAGTVCRPDSAVPRRFSPEESDVAGQNVAGPTTWLFRNYTIAATILVGSLPVLSKRGVGGACLTLETAGTADDLLTSLQFVAGTWPDRLKGFNRFGATQELVRQTQGAVTHSAYLSFMSTCSEKDFTERKRSLADNGPESMYSIARGRSTAAGCTFELRHRPAAARCNWSDCVDFLQSVADWGPLPSVHPLNNSPIGALPTFLFATHRALQTRQPVLYNHNGDVYRLLIRSESTEDDERMLRCSLSKVTEKHSMEFRLWFKQTQTSEFPVRIEFHPPSFLRLTLETNESVHTPVLRPLLGAG